MLGSTCSAEWLGGSESVGAECGVCVPEDGEGRPRVHPVIPVLRVTAGASRAGPPQEQGFPQILEGI